MEVKVMLKNGNHHCLKNGVIYRGSIMGLDFLRLYGKRNNIRFASGHLCDDFIIKMNACNHTGGKWIVINRLPRKIKKKKNAERKKA